MPRVTHGHPGASHATWSSRCLACHIVIQVLPPPSPFTEIRQYLHAIYFPFSRLPVASRPVGPTSTSLASSPPQPTMLCPRGVWRCPAQHPCTAPLHSTLCTAPLLTRPNALPHMWATPNNPNPALNSNQVGRYSDREYISNGISTFVVKYTWSYLASNDVPSYAQATPSHLSHVARSHTSHAGPSHTLSVTWGVSGCMQYTGGPTFYPHN